MDIHNIIKSPIITEKSIERAGKGKFTFHVDRGANKPMIRKAVEEKFKVTVVSITTTTLKGRRKRTGVRRIEVNQPALKRAIVTLVSGQKIDLFDIGEKK